MIKEDYSVTVVVPAYNCRNFIEKCINSILSQTLKSIQLIVVDDCSTDGTYEVLENYGNKIKLIRLDENSGCPGTPRNIGIEQASGEYIAFVDADDWIEEGMYESLYASAKKTSSDIVSAGFFWMEDKNGNKKINIDYNEIINPENDQIDSLKSTCFSSVVCRIYRLSLIKTKNIYFPKMYISEDFCFSSAVHLSANRTSVVNNGWYHYTYNNSGSTTEQRKSIKGLRNVDFFSEGINFFKNIGLWDVWGKNIFKKFLGSIKYTYERMDVDVKRIYSYILYHEINKIENKFLILENDFSNEENNVLKYIGMPWVTAKLGREFIKIEENLIKIANTLYEDGDFSNALRLYQLEKLRSRDISWIIDFNIWKITKNKFELKEISKKNDISNTEVNKDKFEKITRKKYKWHSENRKYHGGRRVNGGTRKTNDVLVSVITTVRNNEKQIQRCIESVKCQTYNNIEHIVIDAASTDTTLDVIKRYENDIEYILSMPDKGIYDGMNKGVQLSAGDYIILLNSDDYFDPNGIEKLVSIAQESSADIVFGSANLVDDAGVLTGTLHSAWDHSVYLRCPARHGAMLVKREVYNCIGLYRDDLQIISDMVWMKNAFAFDLKVAITDFPVFYFSQQGISSTGSSRHDTELVSYLKGNFPLLSDNHVEKLKKTWLLDAKEIEQICAAYPEDVILRKSLGCLWRKKKFNKSTPDVSIQIPVFNAFEMLDKSISSVLNQSCRNYEVVCVDDGSSDKSYDLLRNYAKKDPRFVIHRLDANKGTLQARKECFKIASGDFMMFLDADDYMAERMIEKMHNHAVNNSADFVQCGAAILDDENILSQKLIDEYNKYYNKVPDVYLFGDDVFEEFLKKIKPNFWVSIFSKKVYKKIVEFIPDVPLPHGNDNLLMFMLAYFSKSFFTLDEILYFYCANPSSSNLNKIEAHVARNHIDSRSNALKFSKEFLEKVSPGYSCEWPPIPDFENSTKAYCKKIIERCVQNNPSEKIILLDFFEKKFN